MRSGILQCTTLIFFLLLSTGCVRREVFLVDQGYQGPVVVIFGCPGGSELDPKAFTVDYPIGSDGVLLVEADSPPGAWVHHKFYWVDQDGARTELAYDIERAGVQAFWFHVAGRSSTTEGTDDGFFAFLVGERRQKSQLVKQLKELEGRAAELCIKSRLSVFPAK